MPSVLEHHEKLMDANAPDARRKGKKRGAKITSQDWDLRVIEFSRRKTNGRMAHDEDLRNNNALIYKISARQRGNVNRYLCCHQPNIFSFHTAGM
jgi:hypothetical protein